jgi:iron(III) transport system ATP-binding protein
MVFQSYAIWPHLSVFENVAYPLQVRKLPAATIRDRVRAALQLVEMEPYADRPAPLLSGGQQQRVAIARALSFEPQVLLLDEPLSNLDSRLRASTGDELRALQRRLKITTLYVTHDQDEAMALSDRVVVMQHGRILQAGSPEAIYQRPESRAVAAFFGSPNLVSAQVTSCQRKDAATFVLGVADASGWTGSCLSSEPFDKEEPVLVMTRPENVTLGSAGTLPSPDRNAWRGTVFSSVFRGPRRSMVVDCAGRRINIDVPAMRTASVGEAVTLVSETRSAWALRPDTAS